jgi:major membrane immunogen (membrane-anchored lipoprotein)
VKRTSILAVFSIILALILSGCGTSDSVKSISLTGANSASQFEVYGEGGTMQMTVTAIYNSGKQIDVTNQSTYTVTTVGTDDTGTSLEMPPQTITLSNTGLVTAVTPFICTFVVTSAQGVTPITYAVEGSYQIVATYKGMNSNAQYLPVASAASNSTVTGATCGPVPTS